jgi:WD40 repeat protein
VADTVVSPDGRWVVVCRDDRTVRVWNAVTGARQSPPLGHGGTVRYAAFSRDGRRLLTVSDDRAVRVWDTATGEVLAPPLRHERAVERAFFRDNGDRVCVVQEGGVVWTWDLTPDDRLLEEFRALMPELFDPGAARDRSGAPHEPGLGSDGNGPRPAP